ncbi:PAS domain S-box protein [Bdellovibrio reynosensis]|uniref:histidine kinase n=1 Tax=Bdellovibrio reynosensis TaxID=2835041 RepID=A0ABY4CBS2_9BACT|nr:PAS domain S-box protein [Bdellovibrio reynosensis]UOF01889.1 PAS domain S-box protein [Bdellovibrio reynosensis]
MNSFWDFFSEQNFMPHGHCFLWQPILLGIHAISDLLIGLAYLAISLSLYFIVKRIRIPFSAVMLAFGTFIGACGLTHFMEIWNLWYTDYWASGFVKIVTAAASVITSIWLIKLRPQIFTVAEAAKLAEQRRLDLEAITADLETRVEQRTRELNLSKIETEQGARSLRVVIDALPSLMAAVDPWERYEIVNEAYANWMNKDQEFILGKTLSEIMPSDLYMRIKPHFLKALQGEQQKFEIEVFYPGKGLRYVQANYMPVFDRDQKVVRVILLINDLTEQRKAYEEIKRSENQFRSYFELGGTGSFELDAPTGKFINVNEKFSAISGYSKNELLKMNLEDLVPTEDLTERRQRYHGILLDTESPTSEFTYVRKDGGRFWALVSATVVRNESGTPIRVIGTLQDISKQKETEQELALAKAKAEAANEAKSAFLANMSHEIRTPLGAMIGFAQLLIEDPASPSQQTNHLLTIKRNGEQLFNIINEILDISKVEANKLEIEKQNFSLQETLDDVGALLGFKAQEKGLSFSIQPVSDLPKNIFSDYTRFRQILINIIGNAIKFTEKGSVDVAVQLFLNDKKGESSFLEVIVKDTGPGISNEKRQNLFQPFTQADASMSRKFGGTGLGLYLSRQLARALGGDVILKESSPGKGSTFVVRIDIGEVDKLSLGGPRIVSHFASTRTPRTSYGRVDGAKVVTVDDSSDNLELVYRFLTMAGATVTCFDSAEKAIDYLEGTEVDVVFMDLQMPILNGYEAVEILRKKGYRRPILALTAHAMKGERERCIKAGFSDYLVKPISRSDLIKMVKVYGEKFPEPGPDVVL